MKFAVLSALLTTALAAVIPRQDSLQTFNLTAVDYVVDPTPIPPLGNIQRPGTGIQDIGGPLGWYNSDSKAVKLFIQHNKKEGIAFDATKTSRTIYLRPENEDGLSEVILGNPQMEPNPNDMRETNFTIDTTIITHGQPRYWFGYLHDWDMWSACQVENGWSLYFGRVQGEPGEGCTKNFWLEVFYN